MIIFSELGRVGRLGNALFECAATIGLADSNEDVARFNEDWIHRPYFSVPDELFGDLAGGVPAQTLVPHIDARAAVYLQDYALFEEVMPLIREYFAPSEIARSMLDEQKEFADLPHPVLSVHVRRGDNVYDPGVPDKHLYYPVPDQRYYMDAVDEMRGRHSDVASVAVFSDDIEWCEEHLAADYYHHGLARPKEHEPDFLTAPVLDWIDLQLMARCEHHVLSNSSFGVWGALLAGDEDAIISWPFFGPKLDYIDAALQLPKSWTRFARIDGA